MHGCGVFCCDFNCNSLGYNFKAVAKRSLLLLTVLFSDCRLLASLTLARILMTFSRRTMYFASLLLTILCLFLFSTFSYLISSWEGLVEDVFSLQVASLFSSCLLVISVQLGVQTLPLLLSGELFPADVRATCKVSY